MWNLTFVTQRGACDPTYNFTVDVLNGSITHPNILTFKGRVAQSGAVRASGRVGQRYASGSGRLSGVSGQGAWSGHSGESRCTGVWTARRGGAIRLRRAVAPDSNMRHGENRWACL